MFIVYIFRILLHGIYELIYLTTTKYFENSLGHLANYVLIFALLSPILTFAINELIKREEIKQVQLETI